MLKVCREMLEEVLPGDMFRYDDKGINIGACQSQIVYIKKDARMY